MPTRSAKHPKSLDNRIALGPVLRLMAIAVFSISAVISRSSQPLVVLADDATPATSSTAAGFSPRAAATWVFDLQNPDGGFPGAIGESDPETTINAVLAAYALGLRTPPSQVLAGARNYLVANGPAYATLGPGQAARLALAAIALGESPGAFGGEDPTYCDNVGGVGGINLFGLITEPSDPSVPEAVPAFQGADVRDQAFVLLALAAMYVPVSDAALESFRAAQAPNGGWAQDGSRESAAVDAITTALVVQALAETSHSEEWPDPDMDLRGIEYLRSLQVPGGGFAYDLSEPMVADAASTAAVIQALIAVGEDPASPQWGDTLQALAAFQTLSGGFQARIGEDHPDLQATLWAMPAMVERPLPIAYDCAME